MTSPSADIIVKRARTAAPIRLALHRDDIARVVGGLVAQRIGAHEAVRQVQIDMRAGLERRQFPSIGIGQRKQFYSAACLFDAGDDRLDRGDRTRFHAAFRTVSPTLTMPP